MSVNSRLRLPGTPGTMRLGVARGVGQLFSPTYTQSYNGACDAGIRRLKEQTRYEARRHGRPHDRQSEDIRRAPRPHPRLAPRAFAHTVAEKLLEVERELEYPRLEGTTVCRDTIMRRALSRALTSTAFFNCDGGGYSTKTSANLRKD